MAFRRTTFRIDAQSLTPTPSGGLRVERARLARIGLQTYRTDSGQLVELRSPEEVFSADSLASYRDATLTIRRHPDADVRPENWRELAHGHVAGPAAKAGDWVEAPVVVSSAEAVDGVRRGDLVELSCGYDTDLVHEPGDYQGQRYDARQTNIRVNHLTLLPPGRARAGRDARLQLDDAGERVRRIDSNGDEVVDDDSPNQGEVRMKRKFTVDGITFEVDCDDAGASLLERALTQGAAAKTDAATEKTRADAATKELGETKTKLADATDPQKVAAAVKARVALVDEAVLCGAKRDELAALPDRDVRLKALGATFKVDSDTPEAEIAGAFRFAVSKAKEQKAKKGPARSKGDEGHRDQLDDAGDAIARTLLGDSGDEREGDLTRMLDELDEQETAHRDHMAGRKPADDEGEE